MCIYVYIYIYSDICSKLWGSAVSIKEKKKFYEMKDKVR